MEIKKSELQNALTIVKPALANKELIEQTTSFAFFGGKVITYNDEICISHPVPDLDFEGAIKAEELYQILNKIKKDEIKAIISESQIVFNFGKSKVGINLEAEIKLPLDEIDEAKKWKKLPADFCDCLEMTYPCAGTDMSELIMTNVYIKDNLFVASDRFSIMKAESTGNVSEMLIPARIAPLIIQIQPTKYSLTNGWVHFTNATGTLLACRILEDEYADILKFFKVEGVTIPLPKNLSFMLDRSSVFSKRDAVTDEAVDIIIKDKKFEMSSKNGNGWYKEFAKCDYEDEEIKFSMSPFLLKKIIDKTDSFVLSESAVLFSELNWKYVAMLRA